MEVIIDHWRNYLKPILQVLVLKYYGLSGGIKDPFTAEKASKIKTQGIQISVQNQTYFKLQILIHLTMTYN